MGNEQGNTLGKDGRVTHLHKPNGVYHVSATALSSKCAMDTKTAIQQTHRGRDNGALCVPLAIQNLVFTLRWTSALRTLEPMMTC